MGKDEAFLIPDSGPTSRWTSGATDVHIRIALALAISVASYKPGIAAAATNHQPSADPCFAGAHMALEGLLTVHQEYGPPGWGDDPATDSRWTMVELKVSPTQAAQLRRSLPRCFEAADDLSRIQLWSHSATDFAKYQGKRIHVSGQLTAAGGAPAQIIPAQMDVTTITTVPPKAGEKP